MSEFVQLRDDLLSLREELRASIRVLGSVPGDRRAESLRAIESQFGRAHEHVQSMNDQLVMWVNSEQFQARRFLAETNAELQSLSESYKRERSRSELFSGARADISGGSAEQRIGLIDGRREIERGTGMFVEVVQGLDGIKRAGQGIREEIAMQAGKERTMSGRVDELETEAGRGSNIISRMWLREKVRRAAVWIVVLFVMIGLGVFLYFVFR
jgi:chromosome segregation ATPase